VICLLVEESIPDIIFGNLNILQFVSITSRVQAVRLWLGGWGRLGVTSRGVELVEFGWRVEVVGGWIFKEIGVQPPSASPFLCP